MVDRTQKNEAMQARLEHDIRALYILGVLPRPASRLRSFLIYGDMIAGAECKTTLQDPLEKHRRVTSLTSASGFFVSTRRYC